MKKLTFDQGYVCAVAQIINAHGEGTDTREALEAGGFTSMQSLIDAKIDPYDIETVKNTICQIEERRNRYRVDEEEEIDYTKRSGAV